MNYLERASLQSIHSPVHLLNLIYCRAVTNCSQSSWSAQPFIVVFTVKPLEATIHQVRSFKYNIHRARDKNHRWTMKINEPVFCLFPQSFTNCGDFNRFIGIPRINGYLKNLNELKFIHSLIHPIPMCKFVQWRPECLNYSKYQSIQQIIIFIEIR